MKIGILAVLLFLTTGRLHSQASSYNARVNSFADLVGRWEVLGDQAAGSGIVIADSSNIILTYNGEKKKVLTYALDFSKSPIWFDFTVEEGDSVIKVKSILELIDKTNLKWQLFLNEERSERFSPAKGEFFYLKKSPTSIL